MRIPYLLDVVRVDQAAVIASVSEDPRLDRDFSGPGPLFNRLVARRVRRALHVDGTPLPAVAPRHYPNRAEEQASLEGRLADQIAVGTPAAEQIDRLAAYVRGEQDEAALGPTVQEAIGRIFAEDYRGTRDTWRAAQVLDAAPRTRNPFRLLAWAVTGAVRRSRQTLAQAARSNPAGVHATGIAVHSLVRSLQAMREVWRETASGNVTAEVAVIRSLRAPQTVLRRWSAPATTILGEMRPGALTIFELDAARARAPGPHTTFMTESWTRCPAHAWTAALLHAVWTRARASGGAGGATP